MNYYEEFEKYLPHVIDSMKKMLYSRHKDIFARIDFYNDNIFLEPLLYTYVHQQDTRWLDSIIYGYEQQKKAQINVFTNAGGVVYLPAVGYLRTGFPNATLLLTTTNNEMALTRDNNPVTYDFEPLLFSAHGIEMMKEQHPLLESVFIEQGNQPGDILVADIYKNHLEAFDKGMDIISRNNPGHFRLLLQNMRKAMLFHSERQNSFAVLSAHNMIFLNVNTWDDEVFFADHISHEGGHVTYFTLTYESKSRLFDCHYNTPLGDLIGEPGRYPAVYLFFHGLFTFVEITKTLQRCISQPEFSVRQQHDIKGRFIFHMQRFKLSLDMFAGMNIFQEEGRQWFSLFQEQYLEFEEQFQALLPLYNLSGQPYDFNSKIFAAVNDLQ
ncbi:hypothetical protein [Chitinophaga flava]|uniref:HEXXH motif domain-containing protein n=1 Tax=Chitinophaga flava TaxID=2259036 RepID=A0A365XT42_9BACT|nr:hypothetical protein [Chitinophaga flava]RBL89288.1 hypothetical protein DF182_22465 [Chitinophaga flava]